ncbi:hypothetical protein RIF29_19751 [Crotalaria pallida]|uniref:Uncharacterized protein n=1 Tax=Crotalaria pallida TaxID=3830 RepID=A0AAN9F0F7_CROPI
MPKKRGRPPKSPSSSSKQTPPSLPKHDSVSLDLSLLQDRLLNLEDLDDLSSKQAFELMKSLDVIKEKLKGKQVMPDDVELVSETQFEKPGNVDDPKKTDPKDLNSYEGVGIPAVTNQVNSPENQWQIVTRQRNKGKGNSPPHLVKPDHE